MIVSKNNEYLKKLPLKNVSEINDELRHSFIRLILNEIEFWKNLNLNKLSLDSNSALELFSTIDISKTGFIVELE